MKVRMGFVSNSSSSSFVCDVCGEEASGWDLCLEDAGMIQCKNGHTICISHVPEEIFNKVTEEEIEDPETGEYIENPDYNEDCYYDFPTEYCPVCNFEILTPKDAIRAIKLLSGKTKEECLNELKDKFDGNYDKFLKGAKNED